MKNKPLVTTLVITAILSSLVVLLKYSMSNLFGNIICFPMEQIGKGLRWLSVQNSILNAVALVLYSLLCVSPLVLYACNRNKKKEYKEDILLLLLSLGLFYVIYMMINPARMPIYGLIPISVEMMKVLLCGTIYSILFTYVVLRTIGLFFASDENKLYRYMSALLWITAILFTISIFGLGLQETILKIESIKAANPGTEDGLGITYLFTVLRLIVNSISLMVNVLVIFLVIEVIREYAIDSYSEKLILISHKLSELCKKGLILTFCSGMGLNLLQVFFVKSLRNIDSLIEVPLFSIIFVLGVLIFSKMIATNKALKEDNDSII